MSFVILAAAFAAAPVLGAEGQPASSGASAAPAAPAPMTPERLLRHAGLKFASGELEAARDVAAAAIELAPDDPRGYLQRAMAQLALGAYEAAAQDAGAAIERGFEKPAAYNLRSEALARLGRFEPSLADAEKSIALNPNSPAGYVRRAHTRERMGRPGEEVLEDWRRAAQLDPRHRAELERAAARLAGSAAGPASVPPKALPPSGRPAGRGGLPLLPILGGAAALAVAVAVLAGARQSRSRRVRFGAVMSVSVASGELPAGAVVAGRFIVGRRIERDGPGELYEARDLEDRPLLLRRVPGGAERLARAQAASRLKHPSICAPLDAIADGAHLVLVYEAAEGATLRRTLDRAAGGRLPPEQVLRVMKAACEGLAAAHAAGLSHGALSPAAIVIERAAVRLRDFGAPAGGAAAEYAAPEAGGDGSAAGDIFALGACLYEALTGRPPFRGADAGVDKREGRFIPASQAAEGLPGGIDTFFSRALDPDPQRRFGGAEEMFNAFRAMIIPAVQ